MAAGRLHEAIEAFNKAFNNKEEATYETERLSGRLRPDQ
jgi:hypothetical protein